MAKTRKARPKPKAEITLAVHRVEVPTPSLLVVEDLEDGYDEEKVRGAFVKVAPRLMASERETFDGAGGKRRLLDLGARAVVLAPTFIPDARKAEPERVAKALNPRDAAREWFAEQTAADEGTRAGALSLVLGFMDQEGL